MGEVVPIAVIGLSCRLPEAPDSESFWRLLENGGSAVSERAGVFGAFLENSDLFDPAFFGISPREAAALDHQQRLVLELAWEALEEANIVPARLAGRAVGVFVGAIAADYAGLVQRAGTEAVSRHTLPGLARGLIANRVSHFLGLRCPILTVDPASVRPTRPPGWPGTHFSMSSCTAPAPRSAIRSRPPRSERSSASAAHGAPLRVDSAKIKVGHLEGAAGIVGLLKTVLTLRHRRLPASLNYATPNPAIALDGLGLTVQRETTPWPEPDGPLLAGVSSFGMGGTNCHLVPAGPPASDPPTRRARSRGRPVAGDRPGPAAPHRRRRHARLAGVLAAAARERRRAGSPLHRAGRPCGENRRGGPRMDRRA
ncbi:MAG: hypothetical protein QOE54_4005 [Streptosporangiaceae bacterium]|nr:hypothetical protein [Streptosporangiaceae bacterium]